MILACGSLVAGAISSASPGVYAPTRTQALEVRAPAAFDGLVLEVRDELARRFLDVVDDGLEKRSFENMEEALEVRQVADIVKGAAEVIEKVVGFVINAINQDKLVGKKKKKIFFFLSSNRFFFFLKRLVHNSLSMW